MRDPLIAIAPFLLIIGAGLVLFFGFRALRLVRVLRRRARWDATAAIVTDLAMKRGRGTGANRGQGVKHVPKFESEDAWFITYSYRAAGQQHEGWARCHTMPPPPAGREISVLVDPLRPSRSEFFDHIAVGPRLSGYAITVLIGAALFGRGIVALTHVG